MGNPNRITGEKYMSKTETQSSDVSNLDDLSLKYETQEPRIYEVGYLIVPSIGEDELPQAVTAIKDVILERGAQVISEEYPQLTNLAYTMIKVIDNKHIRFATGYFGWVKFEIMPHHVPEIQKMLDENNSILRYLCIQTVRENTMVTGRIQTRTERTLADTPTENTAPVVSAEEPVASSDEPETPVDEETIDESIENLIID
jgi:ribosomal protein S6